MMDFRRVDVSNQKAYDLLRDWIKLVARHTNPDQDISELLGWLWKLKPATPDPITGLVPCGCGGKAAVKKGVNHRSGYYVICEKCECNIGLDRDDYLRPYGAYPTEEQAVSDWDTAMGYTASPRPGAIGPDAGEMAPNGDEGAES